MKQVAHLHIIVATYNVSTFIYVSGVILIPSAPDGKKNDNIITMTIIFICFYLIVVSLFVTFCDIHCNSLAEPVSSIILHCKR